MPLTICDNMVPFVFPYCSVAFSHFYVLVSNGSHYSNFGNNCPKLGTGTPEDMLFTKGDNLNSVRSEIALIYTIDLR